MDANPIYFPQFTNRESFNEIVGLTDADTGDYLDLTGWTFALEIRRLRPTIWQDSGYTPNYDYGGVNDYGPAIKLSLGSGLTVVDIGQLQIFITEAQMRSLSPDTYSMSMTASNGSETRQVFVGRLPVIFGGVT